MFVVGRGSQSKTDHEDENRNSHVSRCSWPELLLKVLHQSRWFSMKYSPPFWKKKVSVTQNNSRENRAFWRQVVKVFWVLIFAARCARGIFFFLARKVPKKIALFWRNVAGFSWFSDFRKKAFFYTHAHVPPRPTHDKRYFWKYLKPQGRFETPPTWHQSTIWLPPTYI